MALNWELAIQNSRSFWESSRWHLAWTCRLQQYTTLDSSVGRAVDCSCNCQTSIGRWFKSGSREFFSGIICTWKESRHLLGLTQTDLYRFLDSLVVRISACHVEGPGSIPGRGEHFLCKWGGSSECVEHMWSKKTLAIRGIEPVTFALLARRSNQLS